MAENSPMRAILDAGPAERRRRRLRRQTHHPTGVAITTIAPQTLMTRSLLDVFNQREPQQRAATIGEIYSPDIVFNEEDGTVTGTAALQERVQQLLDGAPGFVFTPVGQPIINHDLGRLRWTFGPPDGPPVVFGTDIARIAGHRIQALYVFVEPPSS